MCVYESIDAFKLAWVKELLLRWSGNGSVNFIMVHCMFAFYKRYKFYIFSPQICSFSIFKSTSNGVSYLALINRFGGLKMRCSWDIRDSLLWAICEDLKFGKFFYSKIFVMCVYESIDAFKLAWVKELLLRSSGNGGVNFIMMHCMFAFYKRYKFYIFSPQICSFSIFKSTSNGVSYLGLINRFGGLKMRCSWDIHDSLLWAICEDLKFGKFFYSKIFVMCVYESIDAFKLAWVKELLLRSSGNGGVNFIMVHCMFAFYKRYKFYIFSPQICSFSIFKSTSNWVSYLALINRFGGLKMRCSWDIRDSLLWAIC